MKIALVQSLSGKWGYCPLDLSLIEALRRAETGFETMPQALETAQRVERDATFRVFPCMERA